MRRAAFGEVRACASWTGCAEILNCGDHSKDEIAGRSLEPSRPLPMKALLDSSEWQVAQKSIARASALSATFKSRRRYLFLHQRFRHQPIGFRVYWDLTAL